MFESLDDQIKHDLESQTSKKERWLLYIGVAVASVLIFGGLYFGLRVMQ